jgi:uncharacterized protein YjbJ (UPF0337 family)
VVKASIFVAQSNTLYNTIKMRSEELHKAWEVQKEKLKQKFAALTDNDLLYLEGMENEMVTKLALKLGKNKEEVYKIIKAL